MSVYQLHRLFDRVRQGCPRALRELVARDTQAWVAHHCRGNHYPDPLAL